MLYAVLNKQWSDNLTNIGLQKHSTHNHDYSTIRLQFAGHSWRNRDKLHLKHFSGNKNHRIRSGGRPKQTNWPLTLDVKIYQMQWLTELAGKNVSMQAEFASVNFIGKDFNSDFKSQRSTERRGGLSFVRLPGWTKDFKTHCIYL